MGDFIFIKKRRKKLCVEIIIFVSNYDEFRKAGDFHEHKKIVFILIPIILLFILYKVTYYIDKHLINKNLDPIFVVYINDVNDDGSARYVGIGYEVIHGI